MRQEGNDVAGQRGGMSWMKRRRRRREERGTDHRDRTVIHTQNHQIQTKYVYILYTGNVVALFSCLHHLQCLSASGISMLEGNVL